MNKEEAQTLAARIEREAPGTTALVNLDEIHSRSYHIDVCKPNIIQLCVRSVKQWNECKHLIVKWQSHETERDS